MFRNYDSLNDAGRIERKIIDEDFKLMVINMVTKYKKRKLFRSEAAGLIAYIQEIDPQLLKKYSRPQIGDLIARNFIKQLNANKGGVLDTHEILKKQIGNVRVSSEKVSPEKKMVNYRNCTPHRLESFSTENTAVGSEDQQQTVSAEYLLQPTIIPASRLRSTYLFLDSMDRNLSTDPSVFKWTVLNSANTRQGTVNTLSDKIHNITVIQFSTFTIPYVASADNIYGQLSLLIEEFDSMSVILRNNRRYHMLFNSVITGIRIKQIPIHEDEARFRFSVPVNILDTITLRFFSPYSPVTFLKDRYTDVVITSLNPTQSLLTFTEEHKVIDGELVHITDFNTANPAVDYIQINEINVEEGHIVTFLTNTTLRINVGLSTITPDANNLAKVFIASRRISIPIRIIYMV